MARKKQRGPRIPEICADAEVLGVTRAHLWKVLHNRRHSPALRRRYRDLQKSKKRTAKQGG